MSHGQDARATRYSFAIPPVLGLLSSRSHTMNLNHPLLRRAPEFKKAGRTTWIEKTADRIGVNRVFLRRPAIRIEAADNILISPAHAKVETLARIGPDGEFEEKKVLGKPRVVRLKEVLREEDTSRFAGGDYIKLYLAPWDLHFLVFPADGVVTSYEYRPGWAVPLLFVKRGDVLNERLCVTLETEWGFPMCFVMIGSWMVNGIHHSFEGNTRYRKGEDLGYFKVGSSVVMVFPKGTVRWLCREGDKLRIGTPLAERLLA